MKQWIQFKHFLLILMGMAMGLSIALFVFNEQWFGAIFMIGAGIFLMKIFIIDIMVKVEN